MPAINLLHTNSSHSEFHRLSSELEKELILRDGDFADENYELNKIDFLPDVVLLFIDGIAIACGAFREYDPGSAEIKRMYVSPLHRRMNLGSVVLAEIEQLAKSEKYACCVLETGKNQPEAIAFYLKHGYAQIPCFGRYMDNKNSVCFKKHL
jgi:GNAT superfamily N-acetyltransferase